jgi:hypothetical protein
MDMVKLVCVCVCVHVCAYMCTLKCSCMCIFSINDLPFTETFKHIVSYAVGMVNCATFVQHFIRLKGVGIGVRPRICSEHSQYSSRQLLYQVVLCFILRRLILNHE